MRYGLSSTITIWARTTRTIRKRPLQRHFHSARRRVQAQGGRQLRPESHSLPEPIALVRRFPLPERRRYRPPGGLIAEHPDDAAQHRAVIVSRSPHAWALRW